MFEITKEYIEKHPKTHKKGHNFAKKQNFKNLREALLVFDVINICAKFQLSMLKLVDASPVTRKETKKETNIPRHIQVKNRENPSSSTQRLTAMFVSAWFEVKWAVSIISIYNNTPNKTTKLGDIFIIMNNPHL